MINIRRIHLLRAALTLGGALFAGSALQAQTSDYPNRPVRVIVPFGPGGAVQNLMDRVGRDVAAELGQSLVPEYRGGGAGLVGANAAAKITADGYTLFLGVPSALAVAPVIMKSTARFDAQADFVPMAMLATTPFVVFVNAALPIKDLRALIETARNNPGKLNFGSLGANGTDYIAGDVLQRLTGTRWTNVPYKAVGELLPDMVGGRIDVAIISPIPIRPFVDAGKLRVLAVTAAERSRSAFLKEVPTVAEQGVPGYELISWYAFFGPAGTPPEAVARLNAAVNRTLAKPDIQEWLLGQGLNPLPLSPQAFTDYYKADLTRWARFIQDAKIPTE